MSLQCRFNIWILFEGALLDFLYDYHRLVKVLKFCETWIFRKVEFCKFCWVFEKKWLEFFQKWAWVLVFLRLSFWKKAKWKPCLRHHQFRGALFQIPTFGFERYHYGSFLRLFKIFESLTHSFATRLYLTCRIHFWRSPNPGCTIKGCSLWI